MPKIDVQHKIEYDFITLTVIKIMKMGFRLDVSLMCACDESFITAARKINIFQKIPIIVCKYMNALTEEYMKSYKLRSIVNILTLLRILSLVAS